MIVLSRHWWISGLLMFGATLGSGVPRAGAQPPLEGPEAGVGLSPAPPEPRPDGPRHEALSASSNAIAPALRVPQSPPPPKDEQPTAERPGPDAQWVPGYWLWDPARNDFTWLGGTWLIPPSGSIWVAGRWMRDDVGWYRVPGSWSPLRESAIKATNLVRWRTTGPPADHPDDTPSTAPGPDYFYINGHYTPVGDRLVWTPGFWARVQAGWDWVPARWVRRPDGWDFREGHWVREPVEANASGLPPAIVESTPAQPNPGVDRLPALRDENPRDPIAEAESAARAVNPPAVVVPYPMVGPVPRYVVPGRMIRPPGYPYGPQGVVVPAVTPPFVQRLLNRVLP